MELVSSEAVERLLSQPVAGLAIPGRRGRCIHSPACRDGCQPGTGPVAACTDQCGQDLRIDDHLHTDRHDRNNRLQAATGVAVNRHGVRVVFRSAPVPYRSL
jgi:hypothetical protein